MFAVYRQSNCYFLIKRLFFVVKEMQYVYDK